MCEKVPFIIGFCAGFIMIIHADSVHLLPPLSAEWIDDLTVNLSWSWSKTLHQDCFCFQVKRNGKELGRTRETYYMDELLIESSDEWLYSAGLCPSCENWTSLEAEVIVKAPKARAEVEDFKCYLSSNSMDCSWIPTRIFNFSLSYRECGSKPELLKKGFEKCDQLGWSGRRQVCHLKGNFLQKELCMVASTSDAINTFRAPKALKLPKKMEISEEGPNLKLKLMPLQVQISSYLYNICYSVCDKPRICLEYQMESQMEEKHIKIPYDKSCQYKFWYKVRTDPSAIEIYSDLSEEMVYGSTDRTLTVVAIVIPIIISLCVILSCICFRRHRDIICPDVPDPSIIFKEMINGNKEIKPKVHMYTPVQEPIEPIIIVPHILPSSELVPT
ncbi:uncharacterized protein LOC117386397 [Periophthalmus magnuspinnatus]|uniref:uncharacterized protein LOC117386397 n=1 Tax=Periophthalmus magnuspinnatus TaxID=409849 RepID=UPI00145C0D0B|nr:uncharacterized protein LOC117386397 [Periophthalmus magnuspinnatus]